VTGVVTINYLTPRKILYIICQFDAQWNTGNNLSSQVFRFLWVPDINTKFYDRNDGHPRHECYVISFLDFERYLVLSRNISRRKNIIS